MDYMTSCKKSVESVLLKRSNSFLTIVGLYDMAMWHYMTRVATAFACAIKKCTPHEYQSYLQICVICEFSGVS
jgi:hypothetical protein